MTEGWAAGSSTSNFYKCTGGVWSEFVTIGSDLIDTIGMLSATEGWAAGISGKFYRYGP